eukprot:COSAG02_NODE_27212_length_614_cov_19.712621_1_plen_149_part_10
MERCPICASTARTRREIHAEAAHDSPLRNPISERTVVCGLREPQRARLVHRICVRISLLHAVACDMLLRAPRLRPHPLDDEAREDTAQHQFHNSSESPTRSEPEPEPEPAEQVLPERRSDQQAVHEGIPKAKGSLADIPHEIMARVCTW